MSRHQNLKIQYFFLLVIFSAGFLGYVMQSIDWFRAIPGDLVDARFNSIVLEHVFQWFQGKTPSLWSPAYFYPFENVLAFSDNHFGSFLPYALSRVVGLQREYAFIIWFIVGNLLNFWVCYYVFRNFGFSIVAAAAGAFVYSFALPALPREAHAQLIYRFASPLSFLAFFEFLKNQTLRPLALSVFWLAVQFFCSIYIGFFLVYLLAAVALSMLLIQPKRLFTGWAQKWVVQTYQMRLWGFLLITASVLAIFWLLYHYRITSIEYGIKRPTSEILSMIPNLSSYLIADRSYLTGWLGRLVDHQPMRHELQMFFGFGVWFLTIVGIWQIWREKSLNFIGLIALISFSILFLMTTSVYGKSFYRLIVHLPGVNSIRAVSRIVLMMLLPLAILIAAAFDSVLKHTQEEKSKWILFAVMTMALVIESVYYKPYNSVLGSWTARQQVLKNLLPEKLPDDAILYVTSTVANRDNDTTEVDGVILAQDTGKATLNGYSGNVPPGYFRPDPCLDVRDRLRSYFDHRLNTSHSFDEILQRVVVLSPEKCPNLPALQSDQLFDSALAKQIQLSVSVEIANHLLLAKISIKNASDQKISTLSKKGPIRLSWRIVTVDESGRVLNQPELSSRKDLFFSLEPGMTQTELLGLEEPSKPGRYILQVSLVQEGVAWLHELGMKMAEWQFQIK